MTANAARADVLARALRATVDGDHATLAALCTDDVHVWTPAISASSAAEAIAEIDRRDDAFSEIDLDVVPLDVSGDFACAEWTVQMTHTGTLQLHDEAVEPTGLRVTLHGVTVAEFRDERICSVRQYWDELAVFEQLGLLAANGS